MQWHSILAGNGRNNQIEKAGPTPCEFFEESKEFGPAEGRCFSTREAKYENQQVD